MGRYKSRPVGCSTVSIGGYLLLTRAVNLKILCQIFKARCQLYIIIIIITIQAPTYLRACQRVSRINQQVAIAFVRDEFDLVLHQNNVL